MPGLHWHEIALPPRRWRRLRAACWREWCFGRMAARHLASRIGFMAAVLLGGGLLFQHLEPDKQLSLFEATYYTWSLVFGQAPEAFPQALILRIMFFVVPVLGLTVIIEGIVELSILLRDRRRYERNWCVTMAASMSNHIILIGIGRLGYRAFGLLRRLGESVVVIERDPQNRFLEEVRRDGSPLLIGDARDEALLVAANIAAARSVIVATNDDLGNLEIALDARRLKPGIRIVLRLFDQNMADKIRDGFNIHLAMSQSAMAAPAFALAALDPSIVSSFVIGSQLVAMQQLVLPQRSPLAGRTVAAVMKEYGCGVAQVSPAGRTPILFPAPDTVLRAGDELLIQGPLNTLAKLRVQAQ